jgi:hypothetical protein
MACQKHHNNLDSLKISLMEAAAEIPLEKVHAMIAEWPEHLRLASGQRPHSHSLTIKTIAKKLFGSKSGCSVSVSF